MGRVGASLGAVVLLFAFASSAASQDAPIDPAVRAEGRRLFAEADAHVAAERWALAADAYQRLHDFMSEHGLPRAPVAHWNRGLALMRVPGREQEARAAFQAFLDQSNQLTADEEVRDWRSTAVEHIAELNARIGAADAPPSPSPTPGGGTTQARGLSPVGPVVMAIGLGAAVVGAVFGGLALAREGELSAACGGDVCADGSVTRGTHDEMRAFAGAADGLLIGGAVVALVGVVLLFTLDGGPGDSATRVSWGEGARF